MFLYSSKKLPCVLKLIGMGSNPVNQELTVGVSHYTINRVHSLSPTHLIFKTGNIRAKEHNPSLFFPFPCIFPSREKCFNFLNLLFNMNRGLRICFTKCCFILVAGLDVKAKNYLCLRWMTYLGVLILNNIENIRSFAHKFQLFVGWYCVRKSPPSVEFRLNINE